MCECLLWNLIIGIPMTHPASLTEGKVLARRESRSGSTALVLNYPPNEAARLRDLTQSIRLRGNRKLSLAMVARRSMAVYLDHVASSPDALANEIEALEMLATPIATRRKTTPV
jgi:hypothetical protein